MNVDLKKYKKRLKAIAPDKIEYITWLVSFITGAIAYDLKLYALLGDSSILMFGSMFMLLFWFIDYLIYVILKKKQDKQKVDVKDE